MRNVTVLRAAVAFALAVGGWATSTACSSSTEDRECRIGADCASGQCTADGKCIRDAVPGGDASSGGVDTGAPTDGGTGGDTSTDGPVVGCVPNKDGVITREEVPLQAGLTAKYRVGTNENVSTAGTTKPDGTRAWDFSGPLTSDVTVLLETQPLAGKWYATKFPGATYALKLQEGSDLLGVFETSPGALLLRGVVSPNDDAFTKTELTNAPSVSTIKFPLKVGGAPWTTDVKVTGTAKGVFLGLGYDEKYESVVDARGELKTPLGTFDVLRVKTKLTRTVGVLTTVVRTFAFVTECYSTVALVTSQDDETNEEFTSAKEIRRIVP
ncbi:MAG: hypothetical protein JST00_14575 [Deltaproteobacteria bacterium]|nr:hypothetical protein [Deltaproteobacteria bacterium]